MKILVLNCGSTSIKYKLFDMDEQKVLAQGGIEKIGLHDSFLKITLPNDEKVILEKFIPEHTVGVEFIFEQLTSAKYGCIKSLKEIDAVGHRVVHGGEKFSQAVRITPKVLEEIKSCSELAPLHNPANIKGINAISKILPDVPQVAVFDTSFPKLYPITLICTPCHTYYEKYGVRRYGFHGTSHSYVSKRACEFLGLNYNSTKIITAHIGGGGSIAAIKDGKSIDTSMGMTPVEGLMMGTRSGNVDLGVIMFLMEKEHLTAEDISTIVNKKSGIKGISGISSDMRDIEKAVAEGNQRAALALNMFNYRILKHIGAFAAILNGVDVLVFTGGVGENQSETRRYVCEGLSYLGVEIDSKANKSRGQEIELSTKNSKVRVVVIPTNEEFMIASDTKELI